MKGLIRVFWRFFYFVFITILHIAWYLLLVLTGHSSQDAGKKIRVGWLRTVPPQLGIKSVVHGMPLKEPCLFVANHISYIDPVIILSHVDASVVAKSEISKWPLVGLTGKLVGTIFVNREKKSSRLKTALTIREALETGKSILVFPEGTTSKGISTLDFRPRSFESAWLAGVPVQPIAIHYTLAEVAFIGDDLFLPHFFRLFRTKDISATITFGPVFNADDASRETRTWIELTIGTYHTHG